MANFLKRLFGRISAPEANSTAEVDRIAQLQQTAIKRRKEYAEKKEQAALATDDSLAAALATSRKRMLDAESAHIAALTKWDNKQSGQKSY